MSDTRQMSDERGEPGASPLDTVVSSAIDARARAGSVDTLADGDVQARSDATLVSLDIDPAAPAESVGAADTPTIPGFVFDDRLGTGAFGEVWSAVQVSTGQKVAVKILHHCSEAGLQAMQREVTRLASVAEHPGILTVHDASFTTRPPYLVTPLLATSLDRFLGETSPAQAAVWLDEMARALQYAHGKGIIHCDLKPANILLDARRTVRIVDWGQAQVMGRAGASMGTLWFMPPEQAVIPRGEQEVVPDVTWDVYALGATMYQLLTMQQPRATEAAKTAISSEIGLRVLDVYRERLQGTPLTPLRALNPAVGPDLAAIVEHCLTLDPRQRYQSMGEIVADLERMREGRPLLARPRTLPYVLSCFLRRHAVPVGLTLVFLALLGTTATVSFQRVVAARNAAVQSEAQAVAARNEAVGSLAAFEHKTGLDLGDDPVGTLWLSWAAWHQPESLAYMSTALWQLARTAPLSAVYQMSDPRPAFPDMDFATEFSPDGQVVAMGGLEGNVRLWNVETGQTRVLQTGGMFIKDLRFSPDGKRLYTGTHDNLIRIWDARSGELLQTLQGGPFVALSPDGTRLAGGAHRVLHRWTGDKPGGPDIALDADMARLAHAGRFILTASLDGHAVDVFDAASGQRARRLPMPELVVSLRASRDGRYAAVGCFDGTALVFDTDGWHGLARIQLPNGGGIRHVDVSPQGRLVAVDEGGHVRLHTGRRDVGVEAPGATFVRFSPNGQRFVTTSRDGVVRVFDAASGQPVLAPFRHAGAAVSAAFSPDGGRLVSQGDDGQARLWDLKEMEASGALGWSAPADGLVRVRARPNNEGGLKPAAAFSPDGSLVALSWGKVLSFRDARTGKEMGGPIVQPAELAGLTFGPDGKTVVTLGSDGCARVLEVPSGRVTLQWPLIGKVASLGPRGERVVSADDAGHVTIAEMMTVKPRTLTIDTGLQLREARLSADGTRLLVHTKDQAYQLFDAEKGTPVTDVVREPAGVGVVGWVEGGRKLALTDARGQVWLIDSATGKTVMGKTGGQALPGGFAAKADGSLLAISQRDRTVRFYNPATGQEVGKPLQTHDTTGLLMFLGDGKRIVTAGMDRGVRLWDVETATPLSPGLLEGTVSWSVLSDADATRLLTITEAGYRMWPLPEARAMSRDELTRAARDRTGLTLDANGDVFTSPIDKTVR